ncbi:hypothetical protein [Pandoravirus japonicus]|uniref:Uncharacterized protein n=1 Tax=Pandoravirus japonicus TaxID=2823154 RepID=A0A811BPK8_9VIRU|nr:hypothetical protein [Pandoravirus japonicus]
MAPSTVVLVSFSLFFRRSGSADPACASLRLFFFSTAAAVAFGPLGVPWPRFRAGTQIRAPRKVSPSPSHRDGCDAVALWRAGLGCQSGKKKEKPARQEKGVGHGISEIDDISHFTH